MIRLGILFGSRSGEHEVSCLSATSVINAVDRSKFEVCPIGITKQGVWYLYDGPVELIADGRWQAWAEEACARDPEKYQIAVLGCGGRSLKDVIDFALPILHGPNGEDGTVQGLLELIDIPYGGCGVVGSAVAMDKLVARALFAQHGLPQCEYIGLETEDMERGAELDLPGHFEDREAAWFVKPANMGSSVGISKVRSAAEMEAALKEAFHYDRRVIIEEAIPNAREIEVAVMGNYAPECGAIGEIIPSADFYDYHAKYQDEGASRLCIPAEISPALAERVRSLAVKAYKALDCGGFARVDFLLEKGTENLYLNEINTLPGFTQFSMFPKLMEAAGVPYAAQIERIVELGYERYHAKNHR
jgi:D-alanine-D-alanine ligase